MNKPNTTPDDKEIFVSAIKKDSNGNPVEILTPSGWKKAKIAPVKVWSKK